MTIVDADTANATILYAAPLAMAAAGELIAERSGVVNVGIEGMMLAGAMGAWWSNTHLGAAGGFAGGMASGMLLAAIFAVVALVLKADQIVAGTGINLLALGVTGLLYEGLSQAQQDAPVAGVRAVWMAIAAVVVLAGIGLFLKLTRWGLQLNAVGESPRSADAAGVSVVWVRIGAVLFGGACAGLAGAYLSTMRFEGFRQNMTEGLGFLALALVVFGRWSPGGLLLAVLFFSLVRALAVRLMVGGVMGAQASQLLNMVPYVLSLAVLAGLAGRSRAPEGLGRAYARE